jgi:hypothetical protein
MKSGRDAETITGTGILSGLCRPPFSLFGTNQKLYRSGVLDPL